MVIYKFVPRVCDVCSHNWECMALTLAEVSIYIYMYISLFWRAISDQCTLAGLLVLELLPKVYQRICLSSNQQTHTIFVIQFSSTQSRNLRSFCDYGRHFKAKANHTHSLFTFIIGAVGCEYSFRCVLPRDTRIRPQTDRMRALHTRATHVRTHHSHTRTHHARTARERTRALTYTHIAIIHFPTINSLV